MSRTVLGATHQLVADGGALVGVGAGVGDRDEHRLGRSRRSKSNGRSTF